MNFSVFIVLQQSPVSQHLFHVRKKKPCMIFVFYVFVTIHPFVTVVKLLAGLSDFF